MLALPCWRREEAGAPHTARWTARSWAGRPRQGTAPSCWWLSSWKSVQLSLLPVTPSCVLLRTQRRLADNAFRQQVIDCKTRQLLQTSDCPHPVVCSPVPGSPLCQQGASLQRCRFGRHPCACPGDGRLRARARRRCLPPQPCGNNDASEHDELHSCATGLNLQCLTIQHQTRMFKLCSFFLLMPCEHACSSRTKNDMHCRRPGVQHHAHYIGMFASSGAGC